MTLSTTIVPPEGPREAKICFIGQAPGKDEDFSGRPFVGAAGQLFDRCLKAKGILRSEILITNVFCQRPPNNEVGYFYSTYLTKPTPEGQEHIDRLQRWLTDLLSQRNNTGKGPNILVALGKEAMYHLTGKKEITKYRGSVLPCTLVPGFKVYPMFHPSYINRLLNEPEERLQGMKKVEKQNVLPLTLMDMERVLQQAETPDLFYPKREFEIDLPLDIYLAKLKDLSQKECQVAVDIETIPTSRGPLVWCIGFSDHPSKGFTIPIIKQGSFVWAANEEALIWRAVSEVFLNPKATKIFHNGGFDLAILGRYYGLRCAPGTYADTMWCWQALYPYLKKGLHILTSVLTWEPYYKDDGKYWDGRRIADEAEFTYNCKDVCITREIWPVIAANCKHKGTWSNYERSMKVMPSLLRMMIHGVRFEESKRRALEQDEFLPKIAQAKEVVKNEIGMEVNMDSSDQMKRLFYGYLGLPIQYHRKTKQPTTDKDALNRLRKKYPANPVLKAVSDYKKFSTLVQTFTAMRGEEDGRVRTDYQFISTFRLSSSESHFGAGGNLQNIPVRSDEGRLIRELFVPDDGMVFLSADLEQAEAREVAWLAGDVELVEMFESGTIDVHWENARRIFRIPAVVPYIPRSLFRSPIIGEERTLKELRNMGKTVTHAMNYGMGPVMLQTILIREEVFLDAQTCKTLLAEAQRARPLILEWQRKTREEIRISRTLVTALGDRREFRGRLNDNLFRSAYSYRPQSVVGRLLQEGIQSIHEQINIYDPLLNVHDEVLGQCLPGDLQKAMREIKPLVEIPHEVNKRMLTIPCAFKTGPSWGQMKEVK
ncbi:MAG: DNA polymerase, partial [Candidatus Izemoplasmatales bacterium]